MKIIYQPLFIIFTVNSFLSHVHVVVRFFIKLVKEKYWVNNETCNIIRCFLIFLVHTNSIFLKLIKQNRWDNFLKYQFKSRYKIVLYFSKGNITYWNSQEFLGCKRPFQKIILKKVNLELNSKKTPKNSKIN